VGVVIKGVSDGNGGVGRLVGWLVGWSVGWLVGWLIGRLVGVQGSSCV
jgi:hypothetical protein